MSKFGKSAIANLKEGLERFRNGGSFHQSIVRKVMVKGKPVYCRESFYGPIGKKP